jgi:hypothetical protein
LRLEQHIFETDKIPAADIELIGESLGVKHTLDEDRLQGGTLDYFARPGGWKLRVQRHPWMTGQKTGNYRAISGEGWPTENSYSLPVSECVEFLRKEECSEQNVPVRVASSTVNHGKSVDILG